MRKITIIDDEYTEVAILKDYLEKEGYDVELAVDGEDGFEKLNKRRPDIILLDIIMPKMDGISLLRKIKGESDLKDIPVFMLTKVKQTDMLSEAIVLGAKGYFIKTDIDPKEICDQIEDFFH